MNYSSACKKNLYRNHSVVRRVIDPSQKLCHWPRILTFKWSLHLAFPPRHVDSCFDKWSDCMAQSSIFHILVHQYSMVMWCSSVSRSARDNFCLPVTYYPDETTDFCLISNDRLLVVNHKWELTLYPPVNLLAFQFPAKFSFLASTFRSSLGQIHFTGTQNSPRPCVHRGSRPARSRLLS